MHPPQTLGRAIRRPRCYNLPVLSFLYDTPTLCRFYSEFGSERSEGQDGQSSQSYRSESGVESLLEERSRLAQGSGDSTFRSRSTYPPLRTRTKNTPPRSFAASQWKERKPWTERKPRPEGSFKERGFTERKFSRPQESVETLPSVEEEHVPFDAPGSVSKSEQLDPTTISSNERRAFERLRKLGAAKQASSEPTPVFDPDSEDLDEVLNEAMFNIDSIRHAPARAEAIEEMREKEYTRIVNLFKAASTDIELWQIINREVLEPINTLDLDNPIKEDRAGAAATATSSSNKNSLANPKSFVDSYLTVEPKSREVLMHNFPLHLWTACRIFRSVFPSSGLILSVIPQLRAMGPSIYALGASTRLYNEVVGFTLHNLTDTDRIGEILQEMEDEAIEPDRMTLNMLNDVMRMWRHIRGGMYGEAARVAWETERSRRSLAALAQWRVRIEPVVQQRDVARLNRTSRADFLPKQPGAQDALVF